MTYRVIQWATGSVGSQALRTMAANPRFEIVGAYTYNSDKAGRDIGEICDIEPLGVTATNDLDEILALDADCVAFNALGNTGNPEEALGFICRLLASGKNVVSTAVSTHIYPSVLEDDTLERLEAACREGGVSFHSSGVNPGFSFDVFPITLSAIAGRIDRIYVAELVDMSDYASEAIVHRFIGMGMPADAETPLDTGGSYHLCVQMVADAIGAELDDIRIKHERVPTTRDLDMPWGKVAAGTTAARRMRYEGIVGGESRIQFDIVWRVSDEVAPHWPKGDASYEFAIDGNPSMRGSFDIAAESGRHISMVTGLHAVNAIPYVCSAPVGVQTFLTLPLIGGGYFPGT